LNVPAVRLLRDYGIHKFHHKLNQAGFSTFNRSADAYGLTLILGGGECTLWELASVYRNWAYQLKNYPETKNLRKNNCGNTLSKPIGLHGKQEQALEIEMLGLLEFRPIKL